MVKEGVGREGEAKMEDREKRGRKGRREERRRPLKYSVEKCSVFTNILACQLKEILCSL